MTPQLIGEHRELISRYGNYDIITAHVIFKPGAVLDPSRAYFTILREPVDRALSWLYFASYDVAETYEIRGQPEAARDFLRSDGDSSSPLLDEVLRDQYSRHFLRISNASSSVKSSASKIDLALSALSRYSLVGIYDCLEPFMDDLCNALGLQQKSLPIANVTTRRPKVDEISAKLRNQASSGSRIIDYSDEHFEVQTEVSTKALPPWNLCVPENAVEIVSSLVACRDDTVDVITPGASVRFEFHLHLRVNVRNLLVGIVIYEDSGREDESFPGRDALAPTTVPLLGPA